MRLKKINEEVPYVRLTSKNVTLCSRKSTNWGFTLPQNSLWSSNLYLTTSWKSPQMLLKTNSKPKATVTANYNKLACVQGKLQHRKHMLHLVLWPISLVLSIFFKIGHQLYSPGWMPKNSQSFFLLLNTGTTGMYHYIQLNSEIHTLNQNVK